MGGKGQQSVHPASRVLDLVMSFSITFNDTVYIRTKFLGGKLIPSPPSPPRQNESWALPFLATSTSHMHTHENLIMLYIYTQSIMSTSSS